MDLYYRFWSSDRYRDYLNNTTFISKSHPVKFPLVERTSNFCWQKKKTTTVAIMPLLERKERRVSDFRAPSSLSVMTSASSMSLLKERMQFRQLMASGAGNKVKQMLQMILVIMLPIIALLGLTTVALIIRLDTASKASKAKSQLNKILMVSENFILGLWGSNKESAYLFGF